jgi:alanyl aminopeptidase
MVDDGHAYLFTQGEAVDTRRMVPCFDEPSFKHPWKVTVEAPADQVVLANSRVLTEKPAENGRKSVSFAETAPLASYLLAIAVGPFERVDAGTAGANHVPVQIITPLGHAKEARLAAAMGGPLLEQLETFFGMPYSFDKLDLVVVAEFPGAMENAGLITFNRNRLLATPAQETTDQERKLASFIAHEEAHQWFGNAVTMAWWDDLWLNESFATWLETRIVDKWKPGWKLGSERVANRIHGQEADTLVSARKIRQPITSVDDIENAFDGITYAKGGSILAMFEQSLGAEAFQKGVQAYLRAHSGGNATAKDFLDALTQASGKPVDQWMPTWLDQPGFPRVEVTLDCKPMAAPVIRLHAAALTLLGSASRTAEKWSIPLCVRYGRGAVESRACTLLESDGVLELGPGACPDWVVPNEAGAAFVLAQLEPEQSERLRTRGWAHLTREEKLGTYGDTLMLTQAGLRGLDDTLRWTAQVLADAAGDSRSVDLAQSLLADAHRLFVSDALRPKLQTWTQRVVAAQVKALGFLAKPGESDEFRLLRPRILAIAGRFGRDPMVLAEAKRVVPGYLRGEPGLDEEQVDLMLELVAATADDALVENLIQAAMKAQETDLVRLKHLVRGLAGVRTPKQVERVLSLSLEMKLDARESLELVLLMLEEPETREPTWTFLKAHFDAIATRLPQESVLELFGAPADFCDAPHRAETEAVFRPKLGAVVGSKRLLDQSLESADQCIAYRAAHADELQRFLEAEVR